MRALKSKELLLPVVLFLQWSSVNSGWSPWGEFTPCSRSCGGGVQSRERICIVNRLDSDVCKGKKRVYSMCNVQDCEEMVDLRIAQCQEHNSTPLDGVLYNWRPYYGHGETCKLLCFADGFPFFHELADKVLDGTPCMQDRNRVCLDGECKTVGCDLRIGSHEQLDVCGVCGGDNSTCNTTSDVSGVFSDTRLSPGYTTVIEIPAGAKDIFLREMGENKNSLVFWDSSGENFAIDNSTRQFSPSVNLAGTTFVYQSSDKQNTHGNIRATGPTKLKVTVYAVNQGADNPGIKYSFRQPVGDRSIETSPVKLDNSMQTSQFMPKYESKKTNGSETPHISKPSNIRIKTGHVPSRNYGQTDVRVVDNRVNYDTSENSRYVAKTDDSSLKNTQQFVYQNAVQVFGGDNSIRNNVYKKSEPESLGADKERSAHYIANEIRYHPHDNLASGLELESAHASSRLALLGESRFMWSFGQWTDCSNKCGSGIQRRIVSCIDREKREPADEQYCDRDLRPSTSQRCNSGSCRPDVHSSYVRWQVGEWGPCSSTCDLGDQVQEVFCEAIFDDGTSRTVDDEQCLQQYRSKPQYQRSCNDGVPCHMWMHSEWSQCSVTCGQGTQQRQVHCRSSLDQQILAEDTCIESIRPVAVRRCDMGTCPPSRQIQRENVDRRGSCRSSYYGCCPDEVTPAQDYRGQNCRQAISLSYVPEGNEARLECVGIVGNLNEVNTGYKVEWLKQGLSVPVIKYESYQHTSVQRHPEFSNRVEIVRDMALYIRPVQMSDSGLYTCTVTVQGRAQDLRRQVYLNVKDNIVITEDDSRNTVNRESGYASAETCSQPPLQGSCRNFSVNWFYNSSSSLCERFWYGGCDGNSNNFLNEDLCKAACGPRLEEDVCKLPSMTGRCRARHIRWYYDSARRECLQFTYGGCDGNGNRFRTLADCERQCLSGTEALGDERSICRNSRFGCCPDDVTVALGNNNEGCPNACQKTLYGCCDDDITAAQGPNLEGCEVIEISSGEGAPCDQSEFGCCPDGVTAAKGVDDEGCDIVITAGKDMDKTDTDIIVDSGEVPAHCYLAKNTGPCKDYTVMWYFNIQENKCDRFWFGGCEGNTNRFKSETECLTSCQRSHEKEPDPVVPTCQQSMEVGPCRGALPRFYYNQRTRACEQFSYGGCRGNDNNFERQEDCERTCEVVREKQLTAKEICAQPKETGPCRADMRRYFYNVESKQCELFTYGGCGGNRNNFETNEACLQYCRRQEPSVPDTTRTRQPVCELRPDLGPCDRMITKYFFNITSQRCEPFTYGGCLGNHNNFETQEKCMSYCGLRRGRSRTEDCELGPEVGSCRGSLTRYAYDARLGRCNTFTYGGCQGNGNNFLNESSCMTSCQDVRIVQPERVTRPPDTVRTQLPPARNVDICSLPLQTPCGKRDGTYWYYEKLSGRCREVPNGDCNNNQNNFQSQRECEAYCSRESVCRPLTYETDIRCLAYMEHWTYNRDKNACEMFIYGGCGGSANNFQSQQACNEKCREGTSVTRAPVQPVTRAPEPSTPEDVCAMEESTGNCLAYIRNWRYDSKTGQCVQFTYGGCGGNANNFQSREECERLCTREVVCQKFEDPEIGCLAYMRRWRYDPSTGSCENFIYGGCGGNANNFETLEACDNKCLGRRGEVDNRVENNRPSSWRDICRLQADVGPCRQYIKKWHYNSVSQDCEEFTYGGCLGNHNNFESRVQCMKYCDASRWETRPSNTTPEPEVIDESSGELPTVEPATGIDVCHQDSYTGRCRAYLRRWYYDYTNGVCKQFIYGGCDSNGNNFETQQECESRCNPRDVCLQPQRAGNCMAYIPRYFFDSSAQECREFVFGGCDGNANNFENKEACERRCEPLMRDKVPDIQKPGSCPAVSLTNGDGRCIEQCRKDRDCPDSKKCCVIACSLVCVDPETRERPRPVAKTGYCPAKVDKRGLLGACAPQCKDDSSCPGNLKCCYHGCGLNCVNPVSEEPYQMNAPVSVLASTVSSDTIHLTWYDSALGRDQLIRDSRYYTVRYYSYGLGQYEYMNTTDMRARVTGLRPDTEYEFNVRVNDPPYLSEWSENTRNRTLPRVITKAGQCPVVGSDTFGICVEECQNDGDCEGVEKCCSNGCGQTCVVTADYNLCSLPKDPGSCSNWTVRWFYNAEIQRCDRFWYGGCNQGNENNFLDELTCQRQCTSATRVTTPSPLTARPYDCRRTTFGCCLDRYTPRLDERGSNCAEYNPSVETSGETVVPATPGESVTLRCRYEGSVTWYRDGKLVETDARRRVNPDGTIVVFAATIEDDGMYACHVSGRDGQKTIYRYMLSVRVPIGIIPGTDKILVKPNHQAFLHCEVYGNPKPTVTWRKGNTAIRSGGSYETFSNGTLLIRRASEQDIDSYTCTADNGVSTPAERTVKLQLREMLVARIENDNGRVMEGGRIKLTCEGRGYPVPTITWEKMGRPLTTGGNVFISSDGQLTIRDVTTSDTGTYSCIVSNVDEKIETSTSVQVVPKVMPDDKCEDKTSLMKCRLIVTARLCGYTMYSKICCSSCRSYFNGE